MGLWLMELFMGPDLSTMIELLENIAIKYLDRGKGSYPRIAGFRKTGLFISMIIGRTNHLNFHLKRQ